MDGNGIYKDWGHTTSTDFYDWVDQPVAIPASDSQGSIWSGSAIIDTENVSGFFSNQTAAEDNVVAFFTSYTDPQEAQSLAYSLDGGESFIPDPDNPIISLNRHGFRDPKVTWHEASKKWIMVTTLGDAVAFWTSSDLRDWNQTSVWTPSDPVGIVECPQFLTIPRRDDSGRFIESVYVLLISIGNVLYENVRSAVRYMPGTFDGETFTPTPAPDAVQNGTNYWLQDYDFGPDTYATAFWYDKDAHAQDSVHSISWATQAIGGYACCTPTDTEGWRHTMTTAREHWLDADYRLVTRPASTGPVAGETIIDKSDVESVEFAYDDDLQAQNPAVEFTWTVRARADTTAQLALVSTETGENLTVTVALSAGAASVTLHRSMQGWSSASHIDDWSEASVEPASVKGDEATYSIYGIYDRSIFEIFVNDGDSSGTMLFFANGVVDQILVGSADSIDSTGTSGGASASFDFKATTLRSDWGSSTSSKSAVEETRDEGVIRKQGSDDYVALGIQRRESSTLSKSSAETYVDESVIRKQGSASFRPLG